MAEGPGTSGRQVTIAGRAFTIGAVYAPRPGMGRHKPRRLLDYSEDGPLPGGRVTVAVVSSSSALRKLAGTVWADWAGEEIRS